MNRSIVLFLSLYLSLFSCKQNQNADTIIYGGTIYTVDSINSVIEAVAIKDDLIIKTGDLSEIRKDGFWWKGLDPDIIKRFRSYYEL